MIDEKGYRANVGIVISNIKQQLLLAKRCGEDAWQLPQGGIKGNETDYEALFRELYEEVGLSENQVHVLAKTPKWLRYELPKEYIRKKQKPICVGQKQVWYLLKLLASETEINLNHHTNMEFDDWRWVDYWHPVEIVIDFKKHVYEDMLKSLAPVLFNNQHQVPKYYTRPLKCAAIRFE